MKATYLFLLLTWVFGQKSEIDRRLDQAEQSLSISLESTLIQLQKLDVDEMSDEQKTRYYYYKADCEEYGLKDNVKALHSYLMSYRYAHAAGDAELVRVMSLNIGRIFSSYGNNDESILFYQNALDLTKDSVKQAKVHYNIAKRFRDKGDYQESLSSFKKAIELINSDELKAYFLNSLGNTLSKMGEFQKAEATFLEGLSLSDERMRVRIHHNLGLNSMEQGLKEQAETHFKNALVLKPDNFITLLKLGELLEDVELLKEAASIYPKLESKRLRDLKVYHSLGLLTSNNEHFIKYSIEAEKLQDEQKEASNLLKDKMAEHVQDAIRRQAELQEDKERLRSLLIWSIVAGIVMIPMFLYIQRQMINRRIMKSVDDILNR